MVKCVFCDIVSGVSPATIVQKDEQFTTFHDHRPASTLHLLVITNEHIKDVTQLVDRPNIVDQLVSVARLILQEKNIDISETRLGFHWPPFNLVSHLHLHVIHPVSQMSLLSRSLIFRPGSFWFTSPDEAKAWLQKKRAQPSSL